MNSLAFLYVEDLGFLFFAIAYLISSQALIWAMVRHSAETDLWRTGSVCFIVGWLAYFGSMLNSFNGMLGGYIFGAMASWLMFGFVFDLNLKDRIILSFVMPALAIVCLEFGFWLKFQTLAT